MDLSGGVQLGGVQANVLDHTVRSSHQTVGIKMSRGNETLTSELLATVNPNLGDVYNL